MGPSLFDFDFSVFKNFKITERVSTQFRVEMFNVLNHPGFFVPFTNEALFNAIPVGNSKFNTSGSPVPNAGKIDTTSTDSRQIQFGLKIAF